jgi:hypothetical protein
MSLVTIRGQLGSGAPEVGRFEDHICLFPSLFAGVKFGKRYVQFLEFDVGQIGARQFVPDLVHRWVLGMMQDLIWQSISPTLALYLP